MNQGALNRLFETWEKWQLAAQAATQALHEQTVGIVLKDDVRLAAAQYVANEQISILRNLDLEAALYLDSLAQSLGIEPSVRQAVSKLGKADAEKLHALANEVAVAARNIGALQAKNEKLMGEPARNPDTILRRATLDAA